MLNSDNYVCVWPDGTWCHADEVSQFNHMSDDYATVMVYEHETHEQAADRYARSIGAY